MRLLWSLLCLVLAAPLGATPLDELLAEVKQARVQEARLNREREAAFRRAGERQAELLAEARKALAAEQARSQALKEAFDANEKRLAEAEATLQRRQGDLGELFGVVRQVAGDLMGTLEDSLVSAQYPDRAEQLAPLAQAQRLPTLAELETLWFLLLQEMTESGKVVEYTGRVVAVDGRETTQPVVRLGVFEAVSNGRFLRYRPETGRLEVLPRQPPARFTRLAEALQGATEGPVPMAVDPSRGAILALRVQTPTWRERLEQGGEVGYLILGLAAFGLLLALYRLLALSFTAFKVRRQLADPRHPKANNPLGRVLLAWQANRRADLDTLERKIDEAVVKELPGLQRGLSILRILAVIAPLLGLLGTVTGMIQTFQAITLFGTGDPKLMAGGISQALVTTVLGLMAAIPLIFLHALLTGRSRALAQILEEQSAGIVASQAEALGGREP